MYWVMNHEFFQKPEKNNLGSLHQIVERQQILVQYFT